MSLWMSQVLKPWHIHQEFPHSFLSQWYYSCSMYGTSKQGRNKTKEVILLLLEQHYYSSNNNSIALLNHILILRRIIIRHLENVTLGKQLGCRKVWSYQKSWKIERDEIPVSCLLTLSGLRSLRSRRAGNWTLDCSHKKVLHPHGCFVS